MPEADRELELLREGVEVLRRQGRLDEAVRLAERVRAIEAERKPEVHLEDSVPPGS